MPLASEDDDDDDEAGYDVEELGTLEVSDEEWDDDDSVAAIDEELGVSDKLLLLGLLAELEE